jgi:DNA-binding MarR family transcriptional regulator
MDDHATAAASIYQPATTMNPLNSLPYLLDTSIAKWNQRLGRRLQPVGLTFEQWRVLLVTSKRGPLNIRELSNATLVPHSTIGRWLTTMEQDGLVKRRALPRDQRAVEISITQKGAQPVPARPADRPSRIRVRHSGLHAGRARDAGVVAAAPEEQLRR